jgi:hypothetical protein
MVSTQWLIAGVFVGGVAGGLLVWWAASIHKALGSVIGDTAPDDSATEGPSTTDEVFSLPKSPPDALRSLAEDHEEVQSLYEEIGFSPVLEQRVHHILQGLRASITVEIPDYEDFQEALQEARTEMDLLPTGEGLDDAEARADMEQAKTLLEEIWDRRETPNAVIEKLQEAPVERQLPYVERVPVTREGTIHWRTPMRVSVLRKRPADTQQFRRRLDRLAALVKNSSLPRSQDLESELSAAIGRLRQDLDEETVYAPTLLNRLEQAATAWLEEAPRAEWQAKKDRLNTFLLDVCWLQGARPVLVEDRSRLGDTSAKSVKARYKELAVSCTRDYVNKAWMHKPVLTDWLLAHLLTIEALRASGMAKDRLSVVADEVRSRSYDPKESMRRLREYEEEEGFVQSLAFALLRLRQEKQPVSTS